jgi:hypothetical protein
VILRWPWFARSYNGYSQHDFFNDLFDDRIFELAAEPNTVKNPYVSGMNQIVGELRVGV